MTDLAYRAAALVARGLPQRVSTWLADRCADVYAWLHPRRTRRIAARSRAVGVTDAGMNARETYRAFARTVRDFLALRPNGEPAGHGFVLKTETDAEGAEVLEAVRASGRPVLVVSGHFGPWEVALGWLAGRVGHIEALADRHRAGRVERFFASVRERHGVRTLSGPGAARRALARLQGGGWIAALIDRDSRHRVSAAGSTVRDGGSLVRLDPRPLVLARRSGAIVLPGVALRTGEECIGVRFAEPFLLAPAPGGLSRAAALERLRRFFEGHARANPTEWFEWNGPVKSAGPVESAA